MRQLLATKNRKKILKGVQVRTLHTGDNANPPHTITFWVHGTGQNPLLRKIHMSPPGLSPAAELPEGYGLKKVTQALSIHDAHEFPYAHIYAFGWSGKLSFKARQIAGEDFARTILDVYERYRRQHGQEPRLRIVSHSHGCNVTLNASDHLQAHDLIVDETVFLACPVQHATAHKIGSPVFKNVFALYSTRDMLQIIDPQGLNLEKVESGGKLFSERRFPAQANLVQAQVIWNNARLTHVGFVRERFGRALPSILAELRANKDEMAASDHYEYLIRIT